MTIVIYKSDMTLKEARKRVDAYNRMLRVADVLLWVDQDTGLGVVLRSRDTTNNEMPEKEIKAIEQLTAEDSPENIAPIRMSPDRKRGQTETERIDMDMLISNMLDESCAPKKKGHFSPGLCRDDFDLLQSYCKVTKCNECKLTIDGNVYRCNFKCSPRYWDVPKIKKVLSRFVNKSQRSVE